MNEPLDVIDAIFTTGAQRRLNTDPIPDWMIWSVLDAAIRGPSGGNRQRWGWVVVTDEEVKRRIGASYLDAWKSLHMGRRARLRQFVNSIIGRDPVGTFVQAARRDPNYRSGEHLANNIAKAPVWIFAVVKEIKGAPSVVDGADIYGAVQNLMLAARKYGLGTTLTMLHRRDETSVASTLGLPKDARALALIPMGFPTSGRFFASHRQSVDTVTHWERWGGQRSRPALDGTDRANADVPSRQAPAHSSAV